MTSLQRLKIPHIFKFVSLLCTEKSFTPSKPHLYLNGPRHILQLLRFFSAQRAVNSKNGGEFCRLPKISSDVMRRAQDALLEYLNATRSIQYIVAENMSRNSPEFLGRLLKSVDIDGGGDVGWSLTRFLRYHPINEFEPFFESIGLRPSDYASLLPRDLMFLNDDELLLENYYALFNFGVPRNMIGKIYKEATEVFSYDYGILHSKLRRFQYLGLKRSLLIKIIVLSPYLLWGDMNYDFLFFLDKLKTVGIDNDWLEEHISREHSCNWKRMLELMHLLLVDFGLNGEKVGELIRRCPDLLLESSGRNTFCFLGFLLKFGPTRADVQSVFLHFPPISTVKFTSNLYGCYNFLVEIKMSAQDIGSIFRLHPLLVGSCKLKKFNSLMSIMNCGMNHLCQMVKDDPYVLKKWVLGKRVDRVQEPNRVLRVRTMKTEFLVSLGFVENSKEIETALKVFRGKGAELQKRFDCLVKNGLSREDVIKMVKSAPRILNQSEDLIKAKIDLFVEDLGYPISNLVAYPAIVSYAIQRLKLRMLTYKWLEDEGVVHQKLALGTLLSCPEKNFVRICVNAHPRGPEFWERLKKEIYCE